MSVSVIVLAGGSGSRVQSDVNKVYLPIGGRPMLAYSLTTVARLVDRVVLVIRPEDETAAADLVATLDLSTPVETVTGGATRHQSESRGLEHLAGEIEAGSVEVVAIHDGARPFVTADLLVEVIESARRHGGAIPGLPMPEQLYRRTTDGVEPLPKETLRRVQTPQAFLARPLLDAYRLAAEAGFEGVDTAETLERFGSVEVVMVPGDPRNIKVTFVEDFFRAEDYALSWRDGSWAVE